MRIIRNEEVSVEKWNKLLELSAYSSPFQSKQFYDLFNSVENYNADVFACEDGNEYQSLIVVAVQKEQGIKSYFSRIHQSR